MKALEKRALGYTVSETTAEYDGEGNEIKNRVTTKEVPPDLSAIKMLLDLGGEEEPSEEELEAERKRLLAELGRLKQGKGGKKNGTGKL